MTFNNREDHIYFNAGELVELKADLPNKPVMLVKKVAKFNRVVGTASPDIKGLIGIVCFWFTTEGLYQEASFSTKDLKHAK